MTLGSLFSGSGGFELAGLLTGKIQPVWASEIEPFAVMVTRRRMPWLRHEGDITKMAGSKLEPADIITGGSPCQDLSIAGRKAGLAGERSSLFLEMIRVIKEMQNATDGRYPRFAVWENVPGAFSSNGGLDFRRVLEEFTSLFSPGTDIPMPHSGAWAPAGYLMGDEHGSLAWRVLDAQYWGVPQRRRRIFLVCDTLGGRAPEILFESEGVFRNLAESLGTWQGTSRSPQGSTRQAGGGRGGCMTALCPETAAPLQAREKGGSPFFDSQSLFGAEPQLICVPGSAETPAYCLNDQGGALPTVEGWDGSLMAYCLNKANAFTNVSYSLAGSLEGTDYKDPPIVAALPKTFDVRLTSEGTRNARQNVYETDSSRALCTGGNAPESNYGGIAVVQPVMLDNHPMSSWIGFAKGGVAQTLPGNMGTGGNNTPMVMQPTYALSHNDFMAEPSEEVNAATFSGKDVFGTLTALTGEKLWLGNQEAFSGDYFVRGDGLRVRRLTPTECARLQGFPDRWAKDLALAEEDITEEEMSFWRQAFGWTGKKRTDAAIRQWLLDPHSDAAEYKLWGNGVALPCVTYVMCGIANTIRKEDI